MASRKGSLELERFLEEMITLIDGRLKVQEKTLENLQKETELMKKALNAICRNEKAVDRSVLKVLRQL